MYLLLYKISFGTFSQDFMHFTICYRKCSIKRLGRLFNFRTKRGGGRLIDTKRLLEGGIYFLSKVTHSNHYRNKLTALLNSNNFHTTFAEACKNKLEVNGLPNVLGEQNSERTLINKLLIINK